MNIKPRFYIIAGILLLIIIGGAVALNSSNSSNADPEPTAKPTPTPAVSQTVSVTVLNNIGIKSIDIENLNTGKEYTFTLLSLPGSFNCTRGDYLKIYVTTHDGYEWNGWWFLPMDIWNDDNSAIIGASGNIVSDNQIIMRPDTILLEATPTPEPTPEPTEEP